MQKQNSFFFTCKYEELITRGDLILTKKLDVIHHLYKCCNKERNIFLFRALERAPGGI
jgi:hypothetical protein